MNLKFADAIGLPVAGKCTLFVHGNQLATGGCADIFEAQVCSNRTGDLL